MLKLCYSHLQHLVSSTYKGPWSWILAITGRITYCHVAPARIATPGISNKLILKVTINAAIILINGTVVLLWNL